MLTPAEAIENAIGAARVLPSEHVDIRQSLGRVLAEDVISDIDMPPFDKSAMDGFACRRADLADELTVIEVIPAGSRPERTVGIGECSKIMTGGMVPRGADCVVMKEYAEIVSEGRIRFTGEKTSDNICGMGEDAKAGDIVLKKGTLLRAQHIAVLASFGQATPLVARRPRVAVIATGNELVDPALKPDISQIRNSNSFQIAAQIEQAGAIAEDYGAVADTVEAIDAAFKKALDNSDVVIVSGGVSEGDFDFVPQVMRQNDVDLLFEKIAIKPGNPTVFGVSKKGYCFGLPGNPVSTFVLFELLCKPFLYKLMGHNYRPVNIQMPLDGQLLSKNTERQKWFPVVITEKGTVKPVEYHGSAHINALCSAEGLICVDIGVSRIDKGTLVPVRLI